MKSLEEYTQRVEDWYRKLKPYCANLWFGETVFVVLFLNQEWEDFFLPDLEKEICLVQKKVPSYLLFKPSEYENKLFYVAVKKSVYEGLEQRYADRVHRVETWFRENAPGVSPWKEE